MAKHGAAPEESGEAGAGAPQGLWSVEGASPEGSPLELDRLIHERVRLGIVSALAVNGSMSFTDLKGLLNTSDGNLSAHARRLEEAGYLVCRKSFEGRIPRTDYELTGRGRQELEAYLDHMEALIRATRER